MAHYRTVLNHLGGNRALLTVIRLPDNRATSRLLLSPNPSLRSPVAQDAIAEMEAELDEAAEAREAHAQADPAA